MVIECGSLAAKWKQLSGCLGLPKKLIDSIKQENPNDNSGCWSEVLDQWIKQNYSTEKFGLPSWRSLLRAVAIVDRRLCKELASKHQGMIVLSYTHPIPEIYRNYIKYERFFYVECNSWCRWS